MSTRHHEVGFYKCLVPNLRLRFALSTFRRLGCSLPTPRGVLTSFWFCSMNESAITTFEVADTHFMDVVLLASPSLAVFRYCSGFAQCLGLRLPLSHVVGARARPAARCRVGKFRSTYARARDATPTSSQPDEVRGRVDRSAAIAKDVGGYVLRSFPKNIKRISLKRTPP